MTNHLPYRLADTVGYTTEPRSDNVRWFSSQPWAALRVHESTDHRFHWTIFFYEHIDTVQELCFIGSCDIPAEQAGYDTKALAVTAVTEYYRQQQWRKVPAADGSQ